MNDRNERSAIGGQSKTTEMGVKAQYGVPAERIFNETRNADHIIVIAVKGGKAELLSDGEYDRAVDVLAQVFPDAELPVPSGQLAGAQSER